MGVKLQSSSGGSVEIAAPVTASNYTLTAPAATDTLVGVASAQTLTNKTLTSPTIDSASVPTVSGTAPLYMCRAWVNFNGTGTVAIRASGNVSSITDQGTGGYTINFASALADANYSSVVSISPVAYGNNNGGMVAIASTISGNNQNELAPTTSALGLTVVDRSGAASDVKYVSVAIFR